MKRILMVCGATVGGEWVAGNRLIKAVEKKYGDEVDFDLVTWKDMSRSEKTGAGSFWKNLGADFRTINKTLSDKLAKTRYDFVIVTDDLMALAAFWATRNSQTVVDYWFHGIHSLPLNRISEFNLRQITLKVLEIRAWIGAKRIVVPAIEAQKYIEKRAGLWIGKEKFVVIPNIVPDAFFEPANGGVKFSGKPVILYSGRMSKNKGLENLATAVATLKPDFPGIVLALACPTQGFDAVLFNELSERISSCGATVRLMKDVKERDLAVLYRQAELTVLPSKIEFAPLSILECLAAGGMFVGTNTGNMARLLGEIDERLVLKNGSATEIAKCLKKVLALPKSRKEEIRRLGREVAARFREVNAVEAFKRVYL